MNGIVIDINPVIFQIGAFSLRWYSLAIITGVVAAAMVAAYRSKRKGINVERIYNLLPWVLIGGLVGARLFHVIDNIGYYIANPLQIVMFQAGGLAIWGGVVGGVATAFVYCRLTRLPFLRLVDLAVPSLLVAQIIGRVGCIINGDAWGSITDLPWAFIYTNPAAAIPPSLLGLPTHPYPLYDMLWNLASLAVLLKFEGRFKQEGQLFLSYLSLYAVGRFLLTFVRQEKVWFLGLQEAQIVAIAILVASLAVLAYMFLRRKVSVSGNTMA